MTKEDFALVNASLNAVSAVLLVAGYIVVKRGNYRTHGWMMGSSLVVSTVFLGFYLTSKFLFGENSTKHLGLHPLRILYLVILVPHVLLAVGMLPPILMVVWRAYKRDWVRHRKLARPTFWIWLYVSVTGVVIYLMLYHLFPKLT